MSRTGILMKMHFVKMYDNSKYLLHEVNGFRFNICGT